MDKFIKKLNAYSSHPIRITEYMTSGGEPEESFLKMVENGEKCDGLVISGHHTGAFGGKRADGSLGVSFLEKLSCDERYRDWFYNIKALWLQGCRTLGTGEIVSISEEASADYHTDRVGALLDVDHLEQSFSELNIEFSTTLDQDNPLSSRYLRVFPSANVFGWTKTAPGEVSGSEYSIPFHIAHLAKLMNEEDSFPEEGPLERSWTEGSADRYREALSLILNGGEYAENEQCHIEAWVNQGSLKNISFLGPIQTGEIKNGGVACSMRAWQNHGQVKEQSTEYGFWNPDLQSYPSLMLTGDKILEQASFYNCWLKTATGEELLEVLDRILEDTVFIRYTYNTLLERLQSLRREAEDREKKRTEGIVEENKATEELVNDNRTEEERESGNEREKESESEGSLYAQVIYKLQSSKELGVFLSKKLNSPSLGILRKIDYYAFYEEVYIGQERIKVIILNKVQEIFQSLSGDSYDERDYKLSLLRSLSKHGYFESEEGLNFLKHIMEDPSESIRGDVVVELADLIKEDIGGINKEELLDLLKEFKADPSESVRGVLVRKLAVLIKSDIRGIDKGELLEFLKGFNEDLSGFVRRVLVRKLAVLIKSDIRGIDKGELLEFLKGFKKDPSESMRDTLVYNLWYLIEKDIRGINKEALLEFLKRFKEDLSERVRDTLVISLVELIEKDVRGINKEELLEFLKRFNEDPSEEVRRTLVRRLANLIKEDIRGINKEELLEFLKRFNEDPSEFVKRTLVRKLADLIKEDIRGINKEELLEFLKRFKEDPNEFVRATLVDNLSYLIKEDVRGINKEELLEFLKRFKEDLSERVRVALVANLANLIKEEEEEYTKEELLEFLKGFKKDPSESVRIVLVHFLNVLIKEDIRGINKEELLTLLKGFKEDPSERVREELAFRISSLRETFPELSLTE